MNSNTEPCKYYLNNTCQKGRDCPYSHERPTFGQKSSAPCSYFLKGTCAYGEKCKRPHAQINSEKQAGSDSFGDASGDARSGRVVSPATSASTVDAKDTDDEQGSAHENTWDPSPPDITKEDSPPSNSNQAVKAPCIFMDECTTENCKFSHTKDSPDLDLPESNGAQREFIRETSKKKPSNKPDTRVVCKQFLKGKCKLGAQCNFKHPESPTQVINKSNKSSKGSKKSQGDARNAAPNIESSIPRVEDVADDGWGNQSGDDVGEDYAYTSTQREVDQEQLNQRSGEDGDEDDMYYHENDTSGKSEEDELGKEQDRLGGPDEQWTSQQASPTIIYPPKIKPTKDPINDTSISYSGNGWQERSPPPTSPPTAHQKPAPPPLPQPQPRPQTNLAPLPPVPVPHVSCGLHWSQFADPLANPEIPFCKMQAQGQCQLRENCTFRHSLTVHEYTLIFKDPQPNLLTIQGPISGPATQGTSSANSYAAPLLLPAHHAQPDSGPAVDKPKDKPKGLFGKVCTYYPLGKCRNGETCPYEHVGPPPPPQAPDTANPSSGSEREWGGAFTSQQQINPPKSIQPCKAWASRGICSYGDECHFRHGEPSSIRQALPEDTWVSSTERPSNFGWGSSGEKAPVCSYYQSRTCKKGDNCKFLHEDPSEPETAAEGTTWGGATEEWGGGDGDPTRWGVPDDNEDTWAADAWATPNAVENHSTPANEFPGRGSNRGAKCYSFSDTGSCKRGDSCKFAHDRTSNDRRGQQRGESTQEDGGWPSTDHSSQSAPWVVAPPGPCPYFKKGTCRDGDDCNLSHDDPQSVPVEASNDLQTDEKIEDQPNEDADADTTIHVNGQSTLPPEQEENREKEDSWSGSWHVGEPGIVTAQPTKQVCLCFAEGGCEHEDTCPFLHNAEPGSSIEEPAEKSELREEQNADDADQEEVNPEIEPQQVISEQDSGGSEVAEKEVEPIIHIHPNVERFVFNCAVRFGPDATPQSVTTATESTNVVLSDLPPGITPGEITDLVGSYGEMSGQPIDISETADSACIEVEFANASQAMTAFRQLNGRPFRDIVIGTRLKSRVPITIRNPALLHTLKVSWPTPARFAWSHYSSIAKAKNEATRLDGAIFRDRRLKATFVSPPKRQKDSFAIKLEGLPPDTEKNDVEELCTGCTLVTLNLPTYEGDATRTIRSYILQYGETEPPYVTEPNTAKKTAFFTFRSGKHAASAAEALDGVKQDFLGKQPLSAKLVPYFRYRVVRAQFEAVGGEIDRLKDTGENKCIIQCNDEEHDRKFVSIHIHSSADNISAFTRTDRRLSYLLRGIELQSDGQTIWDDYLETSSSVKALENLNSGAKFHIQRDPRARVIRIFGTPDDQTHATTQLLRILQKVRAHKHEIPLPPARLHKLLHGGLASLVVALGGNKVALEPLASKLVVRGTPEDLSKAQSIVDSLEEPSAPVARRRGCTICSYEPISPIQLSCQHIYCTACLEGVARSQGSAPFQCSFRSETGDIQCPAYVPYVVLRDIFPTQDEQRELLQASFLSHVRSSGGLFFCPTMDCQAVYEVQDGGLTFRCKQCSSELCSSCKSHAHVALTCQQCQILEFDI